MSKAFIMRHRKTGGVGSQWLRIYCRWGQWQRGGRMIRCWSRRTGQQCWPSWLWRRKRPWRSCCKCTTLRWVHLCLTPSESKHLVFHLHLCPRKLQDWSWCLRRRRRCCNRMMLGCSSVYLCSLDLVCSGCCRTTHSCRCLCSRTLSLFVGACRGWRLVTLGNHLRPCRPFWFCLECRRKIPLT